MRRREKERAEEGGAHASENPRTADPGRRDDRQPYASEIEDYSGEIVTPPDVEKDRPIATASRDRRAPRAGPPRM